MAVELNRGKAARLGVRLHCYALDQTISSRSTQSLLSKMDTVICAAVTNAHWGSLVTIQAGVRNGSVELDVHYARLVAGCVSTIDLIDERWSWRLESQAGCSC